MSQDEVCAVCGGSGFVIVERKHLSGATPCACRDRRKVEGVWERARIPEQHAGNSFETFVIPSDNPIARRALAGIMISVKRFAHDFPNAQPPGLLLTGPTGAGKTHLAVAALRQILDKGFEGVFYSYPHLLEDIRAGFSPEANAANRDAYRRAIEAEVLLLDDVGAYRISGWVEDTINLIVSERYNKKKPTIVTTNLRDPDAERKLIDPQNAAEPSRIRYDKTLAEVIGMRARSRLFEMCKIVIMPELGDHRVRNASKT